jgi:hypothetical protein
MYPGERAGILCLGAAESTQPLLECFEKAWSTPGDGVAWAGGWLGMDLGLFLDLDGFGLSAPLPPELARRSWRTAKAAGDPCRLVAGEREPGSFRLEWRRETWDSEQVCAEGKGLRVSLRPNRDGASGYLLLVPRAEGGRPQRMTVVLVETHGALASIPHRFELELEAK